MDFICNADVVDDIVRSAVGSTGQRASNHSAFSIRIAAAAHGRSDTALSIVPGRPVSIQSPASHRPVEAGPCRRPRRLARRQRERRAFSRSPSRARASRARGAGERLGDPRRRARRPLVVARRSASAPLATSDRCDASRCRRPAACRRPTACRPGSPTNGSSITGGRTTDSRSRSASMSIAPASATSRDQRRRRRTAKRSACRTRGRRR